MNEKGKREKFPLTSTELTTVSPSSKNEVKIFIDNTKFCKVEEDTRTETPIILMNISGAVGPVHLLLKKEEAEWIADRLKESIEKM